MDSRLASLALLAMGCTSGEAPDDPAPAPEVASVEPADPAAAARAALQAGAAPGASPLARGTYLTAAVVDCVHCHTHRDVNDFTVALGPEYAGGEVYDESWAMPGTIITPNITPHVETGIGGWTDDEIERAIREGRNRSGERLFPLMPSHYFQAMSDEDVDGIVAFLRSLPPTEMPTEARTVLAIPRSALPELPPITEPVPPVGDDPVKRGEYLVRVANCRTCHAPTKGGQEMADRFLAGGVEFTTPVGKFVTPNITPDPETGIGAWTDDELRTVLTRGKNRLGQPLRMNFMPWWLYQNLTDSDLDAIIAYLRSLEPVRNDVTAPENRFPAGN